MTEVEHIIEHAEQSCKNNGARLTEKRKLILSGLVESGKALSAYELIEYCKAHFDENISAMTMYRVLEFLEQEQLIHKLNLSNKYIACSHIVCNHEHDEVPLFLICNECNNVEETSIMRSMVNTLKQRIEESHCKLVSSQLEVFCLCQDCAQAD
jgi:Fur family zinc uptake transcriptional regulator